MLNVRQDFPIFRNHSNLCYLDSAATTQVPDAVIQTVTRFLGNSNANIGRGIHKLSVRADNTYQLAREKVANFIGTEPNEIAFTQNATASINLLAQSINQNLRSYGKILGTRCAHNSNYLPWLRDRAIRFFDPYQCYREVDLDTVRLVAMTHISNVLGVITPVTGIIKFAHAANLPVLVDATQSIGHMCVNIQNFKPDFMAFSGHKMLGLTGIGVLYVNKQHDLPPVFIGGGSVSEVHESRYTSFRFPRSFEPGTPPIVPAVSLGAAIDYLNALGMQNVEWHIATLTQCCYQGLLELGITPLGGVNKHGLISFNVDNIHPHDVAFELDKLNIAVRAGHHCAPLCHETCGVRASVRVSFHVYNTLDDVRRLLDGLLYIRKTFNPERTP